MFRKITLILASMLVMVTAHAFDGPTTAKATDGTNSITASGATTLSSWGAALQYGRYMKIGRVESGLVFNDYKALSQSGSRYTIGQGMVNAGFLFRLYHTRRYEFNIYAGLGALLGAEIHDPFKMLPADQRPTEELRFIYGFYPKAEMEWFFWQNLALALDVWMPVTINSRMKWVNSAVISLGIRYNF